MWTDEGFTTWFSYDPHGNVEWMIQELRDLGRKTVRKEYDLVSGNVNKVIYMEGTTEQFMHRYEYDEDNRVTKVFTSTDGITWERDAAYEFYRDGGLARKGLGEDLIQGLDYTSTIHGSLKAINQVELDPTGMKDPGMDGSYVGQFRIEDNNLPGQWINYIKVDGSVTLTNVVLFNGDGAKATATDIVAQINAAYDPNSHPYKASNEAGASSVVTVYGPQPPAAGSIQINGVMSATVLSNMSIKNSYIKDEFALELGYYDGDYNRTNSYIGASLDASSDPTMHYPYTSNIGGNAVTSGANSQWNGNIAYWQTNTRAGQGTGNYHGIDHLKLRVFGFDKVNRLKDANYIAYDGSNYQTGKNKEYDEYFEYDKNGNITKAIRHGYKEPTATLTPNCNQSNMELDHLDYAYETDINGKQINRLAGLTENSSAQNPMTLPVGNWGSDLGVQSTDPNYFYDEAGRLIRDVSEGLVIKWNTFHNKPAIVQVSDPSTGQLQHSIYFMYDADGTRVVKETRNPSGLALDRTYYANGGGIIYKREYDGTSTTYTMEEASIVGDGRVGIYLPELELYQASGYSDWLTLPLKPQVLENCTSIPYIAKDGPPKGGGEDPR